MHLRTIPLRTGLGITILLMGLFTILLVFISAEVYRAHAIDNQRAALSGIVQIKAADLLEKLRSNAVRLGLEVQQDKDFRDALQDRNQARLAELLDKPFHQYFMTSDLLRLEQLQVFDSRFAAIASSAETAVPGQAAAPCPDLPVAVLARSGSQHLQPVMQLCDGNGTALLAVVVPVGLRPDGYVQVTTDPVHDLKQLEQELGMPLRLTSAAGTVAYQSQDWDARAADGQSMAVDYQLDSADGNRLLSASLLMNMQDFFANLRRTRDTVMFFVGIATLITVLLARILAENIVIRPLQSLCSQLRRRDHKLLDTELHGRKNILSEFAELKELYGVLEGISLTDPLTGLANRIQLEQRLHSLLHDAAVDDRGHALCYLDLDRFKIVNDTCGHMAGDELLQQIASLLRESVRGHDLVARIGGDEFAILLVGCSPDDARSIAGNLNRAVSELDYSWEGHPFSIGVSIGVVPFRQGKRMSEVLSAADAACYLAKENGRNRVHFYHADDAALIQHRDETRWANRITQAMETDSFELYAQPVVPAVIGNGEQRMREVLLWMIDNDGTRISPRTFIPAAERYNLMSLIDRWVITQLCSRISTEAPDGRPVVYSVNLSGQSLSDENFLHFLIDTLDHSRVPTERLYFEITETAAITNLPKAARMISILKGMGIRFALDDFGSGLSSFSYLKHLNVDFVKIDGSFIRGMAGSPVDCRMVEAINQLAHTMNIKTIAECVENEETFSVLQDIGVDYLQGYYIGRPLPIDRMLVETQPPRDPNAKVVPIR